MAAEVEQDLRHAPAQTHGRVQNEDLNTREPIVLDEVASRKDNGDISHILSYANE